MSRRRLTKGPRRGRKATKRFDPTPLRELVADGLTWNRIGVVADTDGSGDYYERVMDGGTLVDVVVEFFLKPDDKPVTARMSTLVGGNPVRGIFVLPAIGEEWLLVFADGQLSQAIAGFALSRGNMPASAAQATPNNIVIVAPEVRVTNATGGSERRAARENDTVRVTIPANTFLVTATGGALNPTPVEVDGTITSGSDVLKVK